MLFQDRQDAGRQLAKRLTQYSRCEPVILGLPRGGAIVASEIAHALRVPASVIVACKLSAPSYPGLGIGALAEGGVRVIDSLAVRLLGISEDQLIRIEGEEQKRLAKHLELFRGGEPLPEMKGRTIILVDDGLASGLTARAALEVIRGHKPKQVILAVPVSGPDISAAMLNWVDDLVCVGTPPDFLFISDWYTEFDDCPEADVLENLLGTKKYSLEKPSWPELAPPGLADERPAAGTAGGDVANPVKIRTPQGFLEGILEFPLGAAKGVILFAHGSGSDRNSPRNRAVAKALLAVGLATLRIDLLTGEEAQAEAETRHLRFNVGLLGERVFQATDWLLSCPATKGLRIGYFGSSTGASAMLLAAKKRSSDGTPFAMVSRGGRLDFVGPILPAVKAPTLVLIGENDSSLVDCTHEAFEKLGATSKKIVVIEKAGHLFEEEGVMEEVARLAAEWFTRNLS